MHRFCCCCCSRTKDETDSRVRTIAEEDYLLPGGEWDPSLGSHKATRGSSVWSSSSPTKSYALNSVGNYEPPVVPPSKTLPSFDEFRLLRTVGRGAFGKVLLAVHTPTRILYAMKVVPKAKIRTQKQIDRIVAESQILQRIRHPFCVMFQYGFQDDDYLFYVFEFAAGGMLFYHLRQEGRFTEPRARFYFGEIILALDYLHSFGIVFRDLKPENCMLSEQGHIVLTDFGSAKMLEVSEKTSSLAGTPQYIAPEVLRGEPYSWSADWWSCGILLHEMLTGKTPFYSADRVELYKLVLRASFAVPKYVSPRARSLLYLLVNKDPDFRIGCSGGECHARSASEIKQHTFFSETPMDPDEEAQYAAEEGERERHRTAYEKQKRGSRYSGSFMETAGSMIRTFSVSTTKRLSGNKLPYLGTPCEWTWEQLERREVAPLFKPQLSSPTDLRHFDPTLTNIPPTLADLVTTDRSLHLDGFDYVAAEGSADHVTTSLEVAVVNDNSGEAPVSEEHSNSDAETPDLGVRESEVWTNSVAGALEDF